jgi:hypothetical protein
LVDMRSEVRAPLVQAPAGWVARRLLASAPCVQAVMVLGDDGKVLAHERAIGCRESEASEMDHSMIYYARSYSLIFYLRMTGEPVDGELSARIEAIIESPSPVMTR